MATLLMVPGLRVNTRGNEPQHLLGDVESPDLRAGLLLLEDPREAAFSAAHIQYALPPQIAQVIADQLYVVDARIDGRGKVLLVARRFVERGLNPRAQLRGELHACAAPRARGFSEQPLPVQAPASRKTQLKKQHRQECLCHIQARVRKIGSPSF